jgi:hypothetical protein
LKIKLENNFKNIRPVLIVFFTLMLVSFSPNRRDQLKPISAKKLYKNITNNYIDYEVMVMKATMALNIKSKSYNLKANIRIKKDSLIWINLTHSTGIPVVRVLLTNDSIKVLERIDKNYYKGDYKSLSNEFKINFTFNTIMGILTDELISFTKNKKPNRIFESYKSDNDSDNYTLQNYNDRIVKKQKRKGNDFFMLEKILISPDAFKITDFIIEDASENRELRVSYSDFQKIDNIISNADTINENYGLFPHNVIFSLKADSSSTDFELNYSKVKINEDKKFSFRIPDTYEVKEL